jgi:hypothetical protein
MPQPEPPRLLTTQEIETFKEQGFVIAKQLLAPKVFDDWRIKLWQNTILADRQAPDPDFWPAGDFRGPFFGRKLVTGQRNSAILKPELRDRLAYCYPDGGSLADPFPLQPPVGEVLKPVLDQMLGEGTWSPGISHAPDCDAGIEMDVTVFKEPPLPEDRVPDYDGTSEEVLGAHIEGYRGPSKGGPTPQWQIGCSIYLDDTQPGGGNTYGETTVECFLDRGCASTPHRMISARAVSNTITQPYLFFAVSLAAVPPGLPPLLQAVPGRHPVGWCALHFGAGGLCPRPTERAGGGGGRRHPVHPAGVWLHGKRAAGRVRRPTAAGRGGAEAG